MTILITGANRGIGHALLATYQSAGQEVLGTARDTSGYLSLEVTDPKSHKKLANTLSGRPIDLLICNAGVYLDQNESLTDGYAADLWAKSFAVNVTGVFLTVQSLLPNLALSNAPKIAIISSQMASHTRAPGGSYIYRASKAAVLNLGRNLATDLRSRNIPVGIYHPGWVQTDMGGASAEITTKEAAAGLIAQFNALDMTSTGAFMTWDGRAHPY